MKIERKIAEKKVTRRNLRIEGSMPTRAKIKYHEGTDESTEIKNAEDPDVGEIQCASFVETNIDIGMSNFAAIIDDGDIKKIIIPRSGLGEAGNFLFRKPTPDDLITDIATTEGIMCAYSVEIIGKCK